MALERLQCDPVSVEEVIASLQFDGQHLAVHGVIYYGDGCEKDEYLLLPKGGAFDGDQSIPMPVSVDRDKCLLIDEPRLYEALGGSSVCGAFLFKEDAIVVGEIRRQPGSAHPVRIGHLWMILTQNWRDEGLGWTIHRMRVVTFPRDRLPPLPWSGFQGNEHAYPLIEIHPVPGGK